MLPDAGSFFASSGGQRSVGPGVEYTLIVMNHADGPRPVPYVLWTLLTLVCSWFILADCLGTAAWCGVNFAVGVYLFLAVGGFLGLFAGFRAISSSKKVYTWITCISALAIACLSAIFGCSFIFGRDPAVPFTNPLYFGTLHAPIIALYGAAFICCSVEALIYYPTMKNRGSAAGRLTHSNNS
jgi:hypothetical protein